MNNSSIQTLRDAVRVSPDNVPLLLLLANACLDDGAFDESRENYERVLAINRTNRDAMLGVARVLHCLGTESEAAVRCESLVEQCPDFAPAWLLLSRIHLTEKNMAEARRCYREARKADGSIIDAPLEKDLYLDRSSRDEPAEDADRSRGRVTAAGDFAAGDDDDEEDYDDDAYDFAPMERPEITFADVGGMDSVKEEIRMKIIYPLTNPDLFRAYGKKIGGGVLIYGPPGCGKTLISRATAGEIQANFISVGIHQILDMYLGNSEKNLHDLIQMARDNAPAVLFFDEIDALAADRSQMKHSAGRTVINQFLAELDGVEGNNDGILFIGATNAPWHLDPAFRRPGRFDRVLFVPPPDEAARQSIIEIMARDKPIHGLNSRRLAKKTGDFSGADLKAVFDQTVETALARAMKESRVVPMTTEDLLATAKKAGRTTRTWFETARNYAMYANQGGFYDDVLTYLGIKK